MKQVIYFMLAFFLISCGEDKPNFPDDKPTPVLISLDQTKIEFEAEGGTSKLRLIAAGDWEVKDVPEWIFLDKYKGNASAEIKITSDVNESSIPREALLSFTCANQSRTLVINQARIPKEKELAWSPLRFSVFDDVDFVLGDNGIERTYSFSAQEIFLNPYLAAKMKGEIFLGNLVNRSLENSKNMEVYKGYTFNPITAFPLSILVKSKTFIPSQAAQDEYVNEILSSNPKQSEWFLADGKGVVYNSYRELNLIGVGNMGTNLDEVVSGKSYLVQEMTKKNGLIYSFTHTAFTLAMDYERDIVKEALSESDFPPNSISYINEIRYGRVGLLIIESDYHVDKIRRIVNKTLRNDLGELTPAELIIAEELNAYHLYYDKSQSLITVKGKIDAIKAYDTQVTDDLLNIFPYKMVVWDYFDPGPSNITFNYILP